MFEVKQGNQTVARRARPVDRVLNHGAVLRLVAGVGRGLAAVDAFRAPAPSYFLPDVARLHGESHAERRKRDPALVSPDERARGAARALGLARVASQVAFLDARGEVGATLLDVQARFGREPIARKFELAANKQGNVHKKRKREERATVA